MKVSLEIPGEGKRDVTHDVFLKNLQLTSEYKLSMPAEDSQAAAATKEPLAETPASQSCPDWLLGSSVAMSVKTA